MKHTECKDCELSNGDCGHHFKMDGTTNYDIASLSACDQYGNCMFFKPKEEPNGDLISREALKNSILDSHPDDLQQSDINFLTGDIKVSLKFILNIIDNAPTVEEKSYAMGYQDGSEDGLDGIRPQGEWIDIEKEGRTGDGRTFHYPITICSVCKEPTGEFSNFCSNCGADMRGAE